MEPGPRKDGVTWDRDRIIYAMRLFYAREGRPPTSREWNAAGEDNPTAMTCRYRFGTWSAALHAAGFLPNRRQDRIAAKPVKVRTGDVLERGDGTSRCEVLAVHEDRVWVRTLGRTRKYGTITADRIRPVRNGYTVVGRAPVRVAA